MALRGIFGQGAHFFWALLLSLPPPPPPPHIFARPFFSLLIFASGWTNETKERLLVVHVVSALGCICLLLGLQPFRYNTHGRLY